MIRPPAVRLFQQLATRFLAAGCKVPLRGAVASKIPGGGVASWKKGGAQAFPQTKSYKLVWAGRHLLAGAVRGVLGVGVVSWLLARRLLIFLLRFYRECCVPHFST